MNSFPTPASKTKKIPEMEQELVPVELTDRLTDEIIIGLVGAVGSGSSTTGEIISRILKDEYAYDVRYIKLSSIINEKSPSIDLTEVSDDESDRIEKLQDNGNKLRRRFGNSILCEYAIEKIHADREDTDRAQNRRVCWIIDSLKHPDEAKILRDVYGECFWLIGIFAPELIRINRLELNNLNRTYIEKIKDLDYDEGSQSGQSVVDLLPFADYFIRNDQDNRDNLRKSVSRLFELIFGIGVITPSLNETAMHSAGGEALRSACLSRQVGAVILSQKGEQIGQGCNDVPKFGGGVYSSDDEQSDHRCYKWRGGICHNDDRKNRLYSQIASEIKSNDITDIEIINSVRRTEVKNIIEFSRAVHAEMEAIISVARLGNGSTLDATLYCTTFPCHNCARHIVVSGIKRVYYIEAYPKSLALKLHDDAISTTESDSEKKVLFLQYEGISPKSFERVFGMKRQRKINGKIVEYLKPDAHPQTAPPMDGLASREQIVLSRVRRMEQQQEGSDA